ncbi:DUF2656 domain-containing protein [Chamaesiphon sp. GL140_3_metabinner_50]|uniref:DUF2656 domain-containing protein n=1 Tax=Chamaesiphon sp. GL140_3_metabinner_50 TaxID=2970812 RepID=UPI0025FD1E22|nr:DUF2656 domain-containing protein [Chamaesiphon sp. GL140_3_metabinner_50]
MNSPQTLRMLLSHNFDIKDANVPAMSREAFTQVFIDGFSSHLEVQCRQVDNPHWIVEVVCQENLLTPHQLGEKCAEILTTSRTKSSGSIEFDILILGGIKTTPATSSSPDALQANQWGVDVVETKSGDGFLQSIGWDATIAGKSPDSIFKVASRVA